jgi:predicted Rossmann fold nucleotide-binding protein DprA/Smf involved in DNA uptake
MRVAVYRPQRHVIEAHGFTEAAYARNRQIVEACDQLVAFSFSHSGGTAYTVRYAHSMGRPVTVYDWPDLPDLSR